MRPLGDKVLIRPLPADEISKGGIIIPETAKKRPGKAVVIKVSEDITGATVPKEGDTILLSPEVGAPVVYNEEECLMITILDIWAIL